MTETIIEKNYDLKVNNIKLIDSHFGTNIYRIETDRGLFIAKIMPKRFYADLEREGMITEFLLYNNIAVPRFEKTKDGFYSVNTDPFAFHIQEFIKGETLKVNTAPDWFIDKSAQVLGQGS